MSYSEDVIRVHVENADDIKTVKTQESEPEHFNLSTVIVALNTVGYNNFEPVLMEDPLRKDASILSVDNPVVLCHSVAQAMNAANQVAGVPYPQGSYLPAGTSLTLTGKGRMWVAATSASPSRLSVFVNRRGSALWVFLVLAGVLHALRRLIFWITVATLVGFWIPLEPLPPLRLRRGLVHGILS